MDSARSMKLYELYIIPFSADEEKLEVATRRLLRENFGNVFRADEAVPNMQALERVLFDIIYPCPDGEF